MRGRGPELIAQAVITHDSAWQIVLKFLVGCVIWPVGVAFVLAGVDLFKLLPEEQKKEILRRMK